MSNKNKPSRRKIKQAVRRVAMLTGITIRQARPLAKDKAFVRNADHFAKANRCYPVAAGFPHTIPDVGKPFEMTFEFQKNGKRLDAEPLRLVPAPKPMTVMATEWMNELMEQMREIIKKSPVTFIMSTPSRRDGDIGLDQIPFLSPSQPREGFMRQMILGKQRRQPDPTFTFEAPANWKALDDGWNDLLNDKNFFNEKPKDI